ncbi:multicopper oxidase domain-containing protein [Spirillospora sp. NPDC052269]
MDVKKVDPALGGGRPPNRFKASGLRSRHLVAHAVVAAWVVLALLAGSVQHTLPVARWLAVHLFLLGAATTAIMVWSEHFATAMLHAQRPDRHWSDARLAGANLGVVGVLGGVWADLPALTGAGCVLLIPAVAAHLVVLVRMGRGALGGRLAPIADYYRAAAMALIVGAALGWLLAAGKVGPQHFSALKLAHVHVTLLGWIGLPVLGTLFMLWPTVLGVRMAERTTRLARWVLGLTAGGLAVTVTGLAAGWRPAAVLGIASYAAGLVVTMQLLARTVRRRPAISTAAAWTLAAAAAWLCVGVVADLVLLIVRPLAEVLNGVASLVPVLLVGLVAQVLIGALTYLLPIVLTGGPKERAALRTVLEWGWVPRLAVLNAGVALFGLPLPGLFGRVGVLLAGASGAVFLTVVVRVLLRSGQGLRRDAGKAGVRRRPILWGAGAGVVLLVLAVLVANGGRDTGGPAVAGGTTGTGTRTVAVTLADMRIRPAKIEVAAGTVLRLEVTNADAQQHDLKVEGGPTTPMLSKGRTHVLDVGRITKNRQAWCTLPGHRAAGMTMDIVVTDGGTTGGTASGTTGGTGHEGHTSTAGGSGELDLSAPFSAGWRPRTADLAPAPGGKVHKVELHAVHATVEVAPEVRQEMWTFGGTAPGPTLHGEVGDTFEVTLINDDPSMGHGIDFHPGSLSPDEPMRTIPPGQRLVYRFRAERAGAWLYHCSTMPMLQHMGNGMYGAVIIDPPGLRKVDHEYALVSSEIYLGTPGSTAQVTKMRQNTPDAWVFNGVADQYAQRPLKVRAGERARFWLVAAGPSDGVAFHIVGTVFDTVYKEGSYLLRPDEAGGSQALDLGPAQGGFVETTFPAAGHYAFIDHDMRRGEAGAHGMVEVTG